MYDMHHVYDDRFPSPKFSKSSFAKKCQYEFKKFALEFLNVYHCSRKKVQKDFVWENLCENQVSTTVGDGH